MRKLLILCAALSCFAVAASAQDSAGAFDAGSSAEEAAADPAALPAAPKSLIPEARVPWQVGIGFEYQHYNVLGQQFHNLAYTADVTRYFNNWFGLEGTALSGFGSTPTTSTAKSLFLGGGAHVSLADTYHFEPWFHVLVGWERFRFTESNILGDNSHAAFLAGGGLDYKIHGGRLYWRVQADFSGTNMGKPALTWSKDYFVGTGLVLNF
jgi:hypothetical protein